MIKTFHNINLFILKFLIKGLSSPSQFSTQVQSPFQQQTQRYISQSPPPPPPIPSTNTHPINPSIFMPNNHNPNNNDE